MHATFCLSTQPNATQLRYSQLASPTCITIIRDGQLIMDKTYGFGAKGRRVESMSAGKTITAAVMGVVRLRTLMNKLLSSLGCPPLSFFFSYFHMLKRCWHHERPRQAVVQRHAPTITCRSWKPKECSPFDFRPPGTNTFPSSTPSPGSQNEDVQPGQAGPTIRCTRHIC